MEGVGVDSGCNFTDNSPSTHTRYFDRSILEVRHLPFTFRHSAIRRRPSSRKLRDDLENAILDFNGSAKC